MTLSRIAAITIILSEAIRELGSVPSGHLYVRVMHNVNIHEYNNAIDSLKMSRLVTERAHVLTWIGPKPAVKSDS